MYPYFAIYIHIDNGVVLILIETPIFNKIRILHTGESMSEDNLTIVKKKHPHIDEVTQDRLQCTLQILQKFGITPEEACRNLHVFSMNPITMDNYGEILRECGFISVSAKHIIK